ncbi:transglutaminase-like domain-containing protein [Mesoterricola silvestris]|uniref:Transglutaminase-like domain-containing protein n=1 Tax=Mesoterricola silvestris TaxID=2927979 RepID=A0AA48GPJ8_9BACT|nr:transglutaminase-like domain-containing protein [Mesoterricola silvestris]BDU71642.1 hypothetical protein METEAL_08160 [Mesoterricola silvestris]
MNARCLLLALLAATLAAQTVRGLPDWAGPHALREPTVPPAGDPDAWVLLDRTEFAYRGDGEIRKRNFRLVRILTERGLGEGGYAVHGLGGASSRIKRLKGWNLRPDGESVKLDRDYVITVAKGNSANYSTDTTTSAYLPRVVKGSLVAFESEEVITHPLGPLDGTSILEVHPIRRWELAMVKSVGWFTATASDGVRLRVDARHFAPLFAPPDPGATSLALDDVPALAKHESGTPDARNCLPWLALSFSDPTVPNAPDLASWDAYAMWIHGTYEPRTRPARPVDLAGATGLEALRTIRRWMQRELTYKQVYLTPDRGWVPETPEDVRRARFGDCKDLAGLFMAAARDAGFEAVPVLARIGDGTLEADDPVGPFGFNHAIAAIRLQAASGLPAEIATPQGRYLLVDLTEQFTPLGWLGEAHRGRRVLICTGKGATWAAVPDAAIVPSRVDVNLEATETANGGLKGTLSVTETGAGAGLRHLALTGGAREVRERCATLLDFPAGATWDLSPLPDPKDGRDTFRIQVAFELPHALEAAGGEWLLPRLGLPPSPQSIQRLGQPRRLPVSLAGGPAWDWRATLHLREPRLPAMPTGSLETPMRSLRFSAERKAGTLDLHLLQTRREVNYPYERREEGVQAQRSDWKGFRTFVDEALTVTAPRMP